MNQKPPRERSGGTIRPSRHHPSLALETRACTSKLVENKDRAIQSIRSSVKPTDLLTTKKLISVAAGWPSQPAQPTRGTKKKGATRWQKNGKRKRGKHEARKTKGKWRVGGLGGDAGETYLVTFPSMFSGCVLPKTLGLFSLVQGHGQFQTPSLFQSFLHPGPLPGFDSRNIAVRERFPPSAWPDCCF